MVTGRSRFRCEGLQPLDLSSIADEGAGACQEGETPAATLSAKRQGLQADNREASVLGQPGDNGAMRHGNENVHPPPALLKAPRGVNFHLQPGGKGRVTV